MYRETVMGDVPSAIGMYRAILAQKGIARPVAARALWQLGQCQEKLGQRREAHATYARVVREFAAESGIAAQARGKLAGWSDALPGPRNLRFEEGDAGKTPPGWFVPQVEKVSGSLAELRRKGCRSNGGCAVVIAPATATAPDSVGNLMQSFRAAAYRGKTVRLRAWVRVEAGGPEDRAQMWLRVDRPNGKVGFLEDMDGRPVRAAEWTSCEIVAEIDSDAQFVDFGVKSMGRARVWVDEVSFDIVPEEQVTAVRNTIARIYARTDATLDGVSLFRAGGGGHGAQGDTAGRVHAGGTLARHMDARRRRLEADGARTAIARIRGGGAGSGDGARGDRGRQAVRGSAERAGTVSRVGGVRGDSSGRPAGRIGRACAGGRGNRAVGFGSAQGSRRERAGALAGRAASVSRTAGNTGEELRCAGVPGVQQRAEELNAGRSTA